MPQVHPTLALGDLSVGDLVLLRGDPRTFVVVRVWMTLGMVCIRPVHAPPGDEGYVYLLRDKVRESLRAVYCRKILCPKGHNTQ